MKIKYDHDKKYVSESIGVTQKRLEEIEKLGRESVEIQIKHAGKGALSNRIEYIEKGLKGSITPAEYVLIGRVIQQTQDAMKQALFETVFDSFKGRLPMGIEIKIGTTESKKKIKKTVKSSK